jgi:hypothetical protein
MGLAHSPNPPMDGIVLCFDAANVKSYPGSGITWNNLCERTGNATLINGPTYSSDFGGYINFDGSNDYASVPSNTEYLLANEFTMTAWVRPTSNPGNYGAICGTFDNIPNSYYGFNFSIQPNSQRFYFLVGGWNGGSYNYIPASNQYNINEWYHLVGTTKGTTSKFYINGVLNTTYTQAAVAVPGSSITQFLLGRFYQNSNNFYYVGDLASTYLFNRELTETEIKDTFNIQRGRFGV